MGIKKGSSWEAVAFQNPFATYLPNCFFFFFRQRGPFCSLAPYLCPQALLALEAQPLLKVFREPVPLKSCSAALIASLWRYFS